MGDSTKKLLVVEDDKLVRSFISEGLQDLPLRIVFATNGLEGLKFFETDRPDLILSDVLLPKMTGFELCQAIRKQADGLKLPIILMSAVYKSSQVQNEARQKYGANDFLTKPLNLGLLRDRILFHAGEVDSGVDDEGEEAGGAGLQSEAAGGGYQGTFAETPFAEVIGSIVTEKRTGTLTAIKAKVRKTFGFVHGALTGIQSNLLSEVLGRLLVAEGKITQTQCDDTRLISKQRKKRHGDVLVELGLLTADELQAALNRQHAEKFENCFSWAAGEYSFVPEKPKGPAPAGSTPLQHSFKEAVVRRMAFDSIKKRMVPYANQVVSWADFDSDLAGFVLEYDEAELLRLVDGRRTLRNVLEVAPRPEQMLRLAYGFMVLGYMEFKALPDPDSERLSERVSSEMLPVRPADDRGMAPDIPGVIVASHSVPPPAVPSDTLDVPAAQRVPGKLSELPFFERIAEKFKTLDSDDYFQVLGVTRNAGREEVRTAYVELARIFHPAKLSHDIDQAERAKVAAIYLQITKAYETLYDDDDREDYLKSLNG
ncbi:MAG: response regulator [Deltaproteobacteria bacterium]|nr:response regulator [Deltaproteobacteria bacterium]